MSKTSPNGKNAPRASANRTHVRYAFRLFMAGKGPNSQKALANLRSICREHMNGNCSIKTIDVIKNFQAAINENILITPALVMDSPRPRVVVLGSLSDRPKVLAALGLPEADA